MVTDSQIISAIKELSKKGYPPTLRELTNKAGLRSSSTIHRQVSNLRQQGLVDWKLGQTRTLRVVQRV